MKCTGTALPNASMCVHCSALSGLNRREYCLELGIPHSASPLRSAQQRARNKPKPRDESQPKADTSHFARQSDTCTINALRSSLHAQEQHAVSKQMEHLEALGHLARCETQLKQSIRRLQSTEQVHRDQLQAQHQELQAHQAQLCAQRQQMQQMKSAHRIQAEMCSQYMQAWQDASQCLQAHLLVSAECATQLKSLQATHGHLLEACEANSITSALTHTNHMFLQGQDGLTEAQLAFQRSWNKRAQHSRGSKIDDLMLDLAILATFDMSKQTYDTFRPFLNLPNYEWAVRLRKKHDLHMQYTVGNNPEAYKIAKNLYQGQCIITTSDGTRVTRNVECLYNSGLVGRCFPPDVREWPNCADPIPNTLEQLKEYIALCRGKSTILSHELCTVAAHCVTNSRTNFLPLMLFPEPTFGFSSFHHQLLMLDVAAKVWDAGIHSFGDSTDSCSTGISAGLYLMTPSAATMALFPQWMGLDIPSFRFWCPLIAAGTPGQAPNVSASPMHEFWWSWYGETQHTNRNLRKNTGAGTRRLVTGILEDLTQCIATLTQLQDVGEALKRAGIASPGLLSSFLDMCTINSFRDQKSKAAFAFISVPTMAACAREQAAHPLLLYMLIGFYLFEPWYNPKFTSPYFVALFQWTAKILLDQLEAHVALYKLDKRWHLLSETTRRTMDSMAHTAIHHFLKGFRKASQGAFKLSKHWCELSLKKVNTNPLEGYHGACRTHGNDFNKTLAEFIHLISNMVLKQNIRQQLASSHGFAPALPKNRTQSDTHPTLFGKQGVPAILAAVMGIAGTLKPEDLLLGGGGRVQVPGGNKAPATWQELHDVMAQGCQHAEANATTILQHLAPHALATLREHGIQQKAKEWHGRPLSFQDKLVKDDAVFKIAFGPVSPAELAAQIQRTPGGGDNSNAADDALQKQGWDFNCKSQNRLAAMQAYESLVETVSNLKGDMNRVTHTCASGVAVKTLCGALVSLTRALSIWQLREWVNRERGPRFWVGDLPEHRALPPGHNCTFGTLVVVRIAPEAIVLGKVHRIDRVRGEEHQRSCKLVVAGRDQLLTVEICWRVPHPPGADTSCTYFEASGVFLPTCNGQMICAIAPEMCEPAIGSATVPMAQAAHEDFRATHGTFLVEGSLASLRESDDIEVVDQHHSHGDDNNDEDESVVCCRCLKGWWDDTTGHVTCCSGPCERLFHSDCAGVDTTEDNWQCLRCSGVDDAICASCDCEWYCDEKLRGDGSVNPYYTGAMLHCDGQGCGLWYHQTCHVPTINDSFVAPRQAVDRRKKGRKGNFPGKKWHCAACDRDRPRRARQRTPRPLPASPEPSYDVTHWMCTSCNEQNAVSIATCSNTQCRKPRAQVGVDVTMPSKDSGAGLHRRSHRARSNVDDAGRVPWHGVRVADNASNAQQMHGSFESTTVAAPVPMGTDSTAPTGDIVAPVASEATSWLCIACSTVTSVNSDTCCNDDCRKSRAMFGADCLEQRRHSRRRTY